MFRTLLIVSTLLLIARSSAAQTVLRAYVGKDAKAHIVYSTGDTAITGEKDQAGVDEIAVAPNQHTVAWDELVDNPDTSYPIPLAVVVYNAGKKIVISPDAQMVHRFRFVGSGDRIAILFGPVHGDATGAKLYNCDTGEVRASWDLKGPVPPWAKRFDKEE